MLLNLSNDIIVLHLVPCLSSQDLLRLSSCSRNLRLLLLNFAFPHIHRAQLPTHEFWSQLGAVEKWKKPPGRNIASYVSAISSRLPLMNRALKLPKVTAAELTGSLAPNEDQAGQATLRFYARLLHLKMVFKTKESLRQRWNRLSLVNLQSLELLTTFKVNSTGQQDLRYTGLLEALSGNSISGNSISSLEVLIITTHYPDPGLQHVPHQLLRLLTAGHRFPRLSLVRFPLPPVVFHQNNSRIRFLLVTVLTMASRAHQGRSGNPTAWKLGASETPHGICNSSCSCRAQVAASHTPITLNGLEVHSFLSARHFSNHYHRFEEFVTPGLTVAFKSCELETSLAELKTLQSQPTATPQIFASIHIAASYAPHTSMPYCFTFTTALQVHLSDIGTMDLEQHQAWQAFLDSLPRVFPSLARLRITCGYQDITTMDLAYGNALYGQHVPFVLPVMAFDELDVDTRLFLGPIKPNQVCLHNTIVLPTIHAKRLVLRGIVSCTICYKLNLLPATMGGWETVWLVGKFGVKVPIYWEIPENEVELAWAGRIVEACETLKQGGITIKRHVKVDSMGFIVRMLDGVGFA